MRNTLGNAVVSFSLLHDTLSGEWDLTKQTTHIFDEYQRVAVDESAVSIPYLDKENLYVHKIAPYSLVRYRCLVQVFFT